MVRVGLPLLVVFPVLLGWPSPADAQKSRAKKGAEKSCTRAGCHTKIATQHTAMQSGCATCHREADHQRKRFRLVAQGRRLCNLCHSWPARRYGHAAFDAGQCGACHDPHGSPHKANLVDWPPSKLCGKCHPADAAQKQQHKPYGQGECSSCHDPHLADHRPLLRQRPDALCGRCHATDKLLGEPYAHQPVKQGRCLGCHQAHQSPHKALLRDEGRALCRSCHKKPDLKQKVVHDAMEEPCGSCHKPHAAANPKLLSLKQPELCYNCHDAQDGFPVVHGALKLGRCTGCHEPHASRFDKLLRSFRVGDTCFRCHCDDVTGRASTHWPVKGKICDRCHFSHGSKLPALLKVEPIEICDSCHGDKKPVQRPGVMVHGALRRAGCLACHDPHGSSSARLLKKPVNALCSACHPKHADGAHIFVAAGGKKHPVQGVADPLHPGRPLSCASCHAMSSSTSPKLLRGGKSKLAFCRVCHVAGTGRLKPVKARRTGSIPHDYPGLRLQGKKKEK